MASAIWFIKYSSEPFPVIYGLYSWVDGLKKIRGIAVPPILVLCILLYFVCTSTILYLYIVWKYACLCAILRRNFPVQKE